MFLQLVGDGPAISMLKKQANEKLRPGCYKFYGFQKDVSKFYANAGLFILPTRLEAFGLVVVEAMLYGLVVLYFLARFIGKYVGAFAAMSLAGVPKSCQQGLPSALPQMSHKAMSSAPIAQITAPRRPFMALPV